MYNVLDFGAVSLEWGTMIVQLFVLLPALLFYAFVVYFLWSALSFMKKKLQLDRERNQKLAEIVETCKGRQES